uniref:Uncharacterized protein n=1 Tax=Ditylenchus dipsaci TaxID=166011 RepID=A0A915E4E3_9BILA
MLTKKIVNSGADDVKAELKIEEKTEDWKVTKKTRELKIGFNTGLNAMIPEIKLGCGCGYKKASSTGDKHLDGKTTSLRAEGTVAKGKSGYFNVYSASSEERITHIRRLSLTGTVKIGTKHFLKTSYQDTDIAAIIEFILASNDKGDAMKKLQEQLKLLSCVYDQNSIMCDLSTIIVEKEPSITVVEFSSCPHIEQLESTIEGLKSTNEGLKSTNEGLKSTNEGQKATVEAYKKICGLTPDQALQQANGTVV